MVIAINRDVIPDGVQVYDEQRVFMACTPEDSIELHKIIDKIIDKIDQDDKSVEVLAWQGTAI